MKKKNAIERALDHYESLSEIAAVLGLTPQAMSYRRRSGLNLSAEEAQLVSHDSGIPLHELRPDLWHPGSEVL